jgi:hypothetical protein
MAEPAVTIRDLRIRVPGLSRAEAHRLGEAVAREIAQRPPTATSARDLSQLTVRINGSMAQGTSQLAAKIAASVRKGIR